ncbi:MAG: transcription termination/antitermination protein NusA [Clostridia bacterium]|nr:transcription termination/antitermination protein NusA [Clostridia bacterium]
MKKNAKKVNKGEELLAAIRAISAEKNIPEEVLVEALEAALISAYKRNFSAAQNVLVNIDHDTGEIKVYAQKEVVEDVEDMYTQISVEEAKQKYGAYNVGDIVNIEVTPADFGRIAAQAAKNVVTQRIREAERNNIMEEFADKENNIITGVIQRIEKGKVFLAVGNTEALLLQQEQVPGEVYNFHDRLKVYVLKVESGARGVSILVSRSNPGLVKKLFEAEVPEIADGTVEIKGICREAGSRTKIAVVSNDENVDAQGACIGAQGRRVQIVCDEIGGEKIDIIRYSEDPATYIAASLSPSEVISVDVDVENKSAFVVVPDTQLSLAIGKSGQNARLAAKLTGWKIDIKSESAAKEA